MGLPSACSKLPSAYGTDTDFAVASARTRPGTQAGLQRATTLGIILVPAKGFREITKNL
jgi:hypothetical protein